jgi:hypothetical protein
MSTVLKRHSRGILTRAKGDCSDRVHLDCSWNSQTGGWISRGAAKAAQN